MASKVACRKGNATEYRVWACFMVCLWGSFCPFCSVSMEESSVTWPHLTARVAGKYGVALCQGIWEDEFGELMASLHLKRKRGNHRCWCRALYSIFHLLRRKQRKCFSVMWWSSVSLEGKKKEKKAHLIYNVCLFLWCKYSHDGSFQATNMKPSNMDLGSSSRLNEPSSTTFY